MTYHQAQEYLHGTVSRCLVPEVKANEEQYHSEGMNGIKNEV